MIIPKKRGQTKKSTLPTNTNEIPSDHNTITNIEKFRFNPKNELSEEQIILSIQGKKVGSCGNAVVITGKPKSRKSVVAHAMVCSALSKSSILGIEANLPDQRKKVLLIDTEQNEHDLQRSLSRMQSLGKMEELPDNLLVYRFRELNAETIKASIKKLVEDNPDISLVIVDGGLDLLNNMNDIIEVKDTIDWVKTILAQHNICMVMIIHQSKSTQFTIGHFGSFMDRFGQTNIEVVKLESGNSEIKCQHMRSDADFNSYEFYWNYNIDNYSLHWLSEDNIIYNKPSDYPLHKHELIVKQFYNQSESFLYKDFLKLCENSYKKSSNWCKGLVEHLYSENIIVKVGSKIVLFNHEKTDSNTIIPF